MSGYEVHITEGKSHAALLELVLGNRRVRLTVDAEPIETAPHDEVFFLPICLDQPTDVGEDATTDAEVRP